MRQWESSRLIRRMTRDSSFDSGEEPEDESDPDYNPSRDH